MKYLDDGLVKLHDDVMDQLKKLIRETQPAGESGQNVLELCALGCDIGIEIFKLRKYLENKSIPTPGQINEKRELINNYLSFECKELTIK